MYPSQLKTLKEIFQTKCGFCSEGTYVYDGIAPCYFNCEMCAGTGMKINREVYLKILEILHDDDSDLSNL